MNILFFILVFSYGKIASGSGISKRIQEDVMNYFNDGKIRLFNEKWEAHRVSVENALELALKETFGKPALNLYVKSVDDTHKVTEGFLVHDRVVSVLFKDLNLARYPYLRNPRVWFPLASNVLRVEATVSKMFIHSEYILFRNYTDVVYPVDKEQETNSSPFTRQQVQNRGQATIIAEHCVLHGDTIAILHGLNVNLGYNDFALDNCKFSVEISAPGLGSPPVIVPYFSEEQGLQLSRCLMMTLHDELMPKLQAAVHSVVNTTTALGKLMPEVRQLQRGLFRRTTDYAMELIRNINKMTSLKNVASEEWSDSRIIWMEKYNGEVVQNEISLTDITISGFDSAYTGRSAGPVKTDTIKIYEDLRFHGIQLSGTGFINMNGKENTFTFSSEIQDVMCKVSFEISKIEAESSPPMLLPKASQSLQISGWRNLEIFGPPFPIIDTYAWITGVLLNRAPVVILKHLSKNFNDAIHDRDEPTEDKQPLTMADSEQQSKEDQEDAEDIKKMNSQDTVPNTSDERLEHKSEANPASDFASAVETEGHSSEKEHITKSSEGQASDQDSPSADGDDMHVFKNIKNEKDTALFKENFFDKKFFSGGSASDENDKGSDNEDNPSRKRNIKSNKLLHKHAHMSDNEIRSE